MVHRIVLTILYCLTFLVPALYPTGGSAQQEQTVKLLRITPNGQDVPAGRQIVLQFDRPVVPIGRMERSADEIPVTVTPELDCQWRWLNTSALACQLDDSSPLQPATTYRVEIRPGLLDPSGAAIGEPVSHTFVTERPKATYYSFRTWRSPGTPVIQIVFNQPVSQTSIETHLFFQTNTSVTQVTAEPDPYDAEPPRILPLPGEKAALIVPGEEKSIQTVNATENATGEMFRRTWLISPVTGLAEDTSARLRVRPGLVSALGPERGIEDRVIVSFDTFPPFRFLGVRCTTNNDTSVLITPGGSSTDLCDPLGRTALAFSSPVINEEVKQHVAFNPDLAGNRTDYDPWENIYSGTSLYMPHQKGREYHTPLPEALRADTLYSIEGDGLLRDEFGRSLPAPLNAAFSTDHRRPDLRLVHQRAVLEKGVDSHIPLYVTNLDRLRFRFTALFADHSRTGLNATADVPHVRDVAFGLPMPVRSMLDNRSGVAVGTILPDPPVVRGSYRHTPWFFAQVTPFQVHVKLGHFNTLVWVTDMGTGQPVTGATVQVFKARYRILEEKRTPLEQAVTDARGLAFLPGSERLDPDLTLYNAWDESAPRLFVRVVKDNDLALLPLDYDFRISTYRASGRSVSSWRRQAYDHIETWGATAQGIYRAGDTVQYKIYVRNNSNLRLVSPPRSGYTLQVLDPADQVVHEVKEILLSEFGAMHGAFTLPENGKMGWYRFQLTADFHQEPWHPLRVLVSDFTPAPFKVHAEINGDLFRPEDRMEMSASAWLHAGGPYVDAQVRITTTLASRPFRSDHPAARGFFFNSYLPGQRGVQTIGQETGTLDTQGEFDTALVLPDASVLYGELTVEGSVRDDRGKFVADMARAAFVGRDRFVGLKSTAWLFREDERAEVLALVVDAHGRPAKDETVAVTVERRETKASRVKGAGNAYLTRYEHEWVVTDRFELLSGTELTSITFTPEQPGTYRVSAEVTDGSGRIHLTQLHVWVAGKGRVLWELPEDGSLEIIPEKETYQAGDTARFLVKNPYPGATALITMERYGVMRQRLEVLEGNTPVVEIQIEPDDLPGFYLSVLVVSPRVDKPLGEGQVDLGKPAFRLGYVTVEVTDQSKRLPVRVALDKTVYKPRDTVTADIVVERSVAKDGPVELAVAVLDEALLDLIHQGEDAYDPYKGFYSLKSLDLTNYSLLTRLVGRQKFEKKGANVGGDGGPDLSLRSLFKFVAHWEPALELDEEGRARISFEVPDNLTGWRVLVMAVTPTDRMGLGQADFKVNRPTELRPVMPNQVLEQDAFTAGFTVMNRTDKKRTLEVSVNVNGPLDEPARLETALELLPYKRQSVFLPVVTNGPGLLRFTATAGDDLDRDGLVHDVLVNKQRSLVTAASYGSSESGPVTETIRFPSGMHSDAGSLSVQLTPTVIGNLAGAFAYMRDYPYTCWEQVLSKGVMAATYQKLKDRLPPDAKWPESNDLPQRTLDRAGSFQAPNGGMVFWIPQDRYVSPYLSAYTALAFNWLRNFGYRVPGDVESRLHGYLETLLKRDVLPSFYTRGMSSTVRAVALAALAEHGSIQPEDIERYVPHVPQMTLFGMAHFLQAAVMAKADPTTIASVTDHILSHSSQSGGKIQFNEPWDDGYDYLLATPLRSNAAVLKALLQLREIGPEQSLPPDLPMQMLRAITQARGSRTHWENTQENVFCTAALAAYARSFERQRPNVRVQAAVNGSPLGESVFTSFADPAVRFERPVQAGDPGSEQTVRIDREGVGRLYHALHLTYAPTTTASRRINAGIDIRREYSVERDGQWVLLSSPMRVQRGELVRVDLFVSLPTARHYVVVDDPVPGGLEPVNRDLATASVVDADKGGYQASGGSWWFHYGDWSTYGASLWSFYHQELGFAAARFYSDYLPAGNYHLSYTAQAIAPGSFTVLPVHAEEMYDPDVFGKGVQDELNVVLESGLSP